ncbi:hypothetical protein AOC36_07590 [Erysipelothrix larvae]|uniref:DUF1835 domain-containing protein n=1 Tax=Erysipelothrix larvae TaxID=1514105 RepID=A0A0X8H0K8_9FIRM|nr:DUF3658 domain-containing protein [Erysipelothrix larvae]AMC93851.1 hypothetical protein AOC36_07590 [Erysipelothrix larvae]
MLDIVFNDSFHASLAIKTRNANKDPENIIGLGHFLDLGDISETFDSNQRLNSLKELFSIYSFTDEDVEAMFSDRIKGREKLFKHIRQHDLLQVWVDNTPETWCGLYHLCYVLQNQSYTLRVNRLETNVKYNVTYGSWREVNVESIDDMIGHTEILNESTKEVMAQQWETLAAENANLRVIINGMLMSVRDDFYDFLIDKWTPEGPFAIAELIGRIIGNEMPGIRDVWLFHRIQHHLETHTFRLVQKQAQVSFDDSPFMDIIELV